MKARITWKRGDIDTEEYYAYNSDCDELGRLSYEAVGRHVHWCWYQEEDIRMSPGCLQEVRDKQKELLREKKNEKTRN